MYISKYPKKKKKIRFQSYLPSAIWKDKAFSLLPVNYFMFNSSLKHV